MLQDGDDGMSHIEKHVWEFARDQAELSLVASEIKVYLEELAQSASITVHAVESRAKGLVSYEAKTSRVRDDGSRRYADPSQEIHDCVAARVMLFTTSARKDLSELITTRTTVIERKFPGDTKLNGYDSEHIVITGLQQEDARKRYPHLAKYFAKYPGLEIQLRSVAAHAWAEYEHDVRYKAGAYHALSSDRQRKIDQWFVEAGGMRKVMDYLFGKIEYEMLDKEPSGPDAALVDEDEVDDSTDDVEVKLLDIEVLRSFISTRYAPSDPGDGADVEVILEQLLSMDVRTLPQLEASLNDLEEGFVATLMDYPRRVSGARRLDDEILSVFTDRYVEAAAEEDRANLLLLRLRRVRGKFAIYSIREGSSESRPVSAARALRQLAERVAREVGIAEVDVEGYVSSAPNALNPSMKEKGIKTPGGVVYVSTNLTRTAAELVMRALLNKMPAADIQVVRAGDVILP
jgi:ppGpp synthetase/RelA/SpoT-type nucleotidyltranferase